MKCRDIIHSEKFQESLKRAAKDHKLAIEDVQKEAEKYIKELYAQQHPAARLVSVRGFDYILSRAYSEKIDVDPKGIKKLMKLMRKHSVRFYHDPQDLSGYLGPHLYLGAVWDARPLFLWWDKPGVPRIEAIGKSARHCLYP